MFLCAALRSPKICGNFVSKLKKVKNKDHSEGKEITLIDAEGEIEGKSLTIYDNTMRRLLWHTSCARYLTEGTIEQPVGLRTKRMSACEHIQGLI